MTIDELRYTLETKVALVRGRVKVFKLITHRKTHIMHLLGALLVAQQEMLDVMAQEDEALCAHIRKNGRLHVATRFEEYRHIARLSESQRRTLARLGRL